MKEPQVIPNVDEDDQVVDEVLPAKLAGKLKPILDPMEHFEKLGALLPQLRAASIKLTHPQDWVRMGGSVYFQGIGAERIAPMWALHLGEPIVERENYPDGTFAYVVTGGILSRLTGVSYSGVQGGRWSGEDFFERWSAPKPPRNDWNKLTPAERIAWMDEHRLPPNPLDVRKAAVTNWQVRAVTMITGLRGLTPEDLAKHGVQAKSGFDYAAGKEGGKAQATNAAGDKVLPFQKGSWAGKTLKELSDKDLSAVMAYMQAQADDPAKKNFKASNDQWIADCEREIERRSREEGPA